MIIHDQGAKHTGVSCGFGPVAWWDRIHSTLLVQTHGPYVGPIGGGNPISSSSWNPERPREAARRKTEKRRFSRPNPKKGRPGQTPQVSRAKDAKDISIIYVGS